VGTVASFAGFPSGKSPYVPVPEVFFTEVLPEIEDSAELKVTLHLFWLLARKQGNPHCASDRELLADRVLLQSLRRRGDPRPAQERVQQGLDQAVARGTLLRIYLRVVSEENQGKQVAEVIGWYFFNTARSRKVVAELQGGEVIPARLLMSDEQPATQQDEQPISGAMDPASGGQHVRNGEGKETDPKVQVQIERPNIFVLYEQNIGLLSPMIAEELKDAADHYPEEWIESAFREAILYNKRKWSYIRAILRRWETEGRQAWNA
jgi:DNA replication protein